MISYGQWLMIFLKFFAFFIHIINKYFNENNLNLILIATELNSNHEKIFDYDIWVNDRSYLLILMFKKINAKLEIIAEIKWNFLDKYSYKKE
jgi:hypothetical protein